jgi:hypothetical protein
MRDSSKIVFLLRATVLWLVMFTFSRLFEADLQEIYSDGMLWPTTITSTSASSTRPKIAIVTGFVGNQENKDARLGEELFDHLVNKICYADLFFFFFFFCFFF